MPEFRVRAGCVRFPVGRRMQWTPEFVVGRLWRFFGWFRGWSEPVPPFEPLSHYTSHFLSHYKFFRILLVPLVPLVIVGVVRSV